MVSSWWLRVSAESAAKQEKTKHQALGGWGGHVTMWPDAGRYSDQ